jgi:NADPH:quinone reductase-like Zn-dependent oxidoreductase
MAVLVTSLRHKPKRLSLEQAAAVGVTYLAAWLGVVEYAQLTSGETLLVIGAGGGVGGAAAQIGKWRGAHVIGVDRPNYERIRRQQGRWMIFLSSKTGPSIPLSLAQRAAAAHRLSSTPSADRCSSRR